MSRPAMLPPLGLRLARTAHTVSQAFERAMAEAGGSASAWQVLLLVRSGEWGTQARIAEAMGITGATLTHHLNGLEAQGLVRRWRDASNRRVQRVELTDAGAELFERLREVAVSARRAAALPPLRGGGRAARRRCSRSCRPGSARDSPSRRRATPDDDPPAPRRLLRARHRAPARRPRLQLPRRATAAASTDADGARAHPRARRSRPAWQDVWICPYPSGHLQATGIDAAGPQAVPATTPAWRAPPRRREVRRHGRASRARCPRCASASAADLAAPTPSSRASACWPAPCACSTAASSASAPRSTRSPTRPTGWRRCARSHVTVLERRRDGLRLPGQERQAPRAGGRRPRRGRRSSGSSSAAAAAGPSCSPTSDGRPLARRPLRRHQRLPQGRHRRRLLRQGLPHLERDRARRGGAGGRRAGRRHARPRASARCTRAVKEVATTSATRRRSRARPTSTRACSTPTAPGWSSARTCTTSTPGRAADPPPRRSRRRCSTSSTPAPRAPGVERIAA